MGKTTGISWCDATVNFWHGCKKVSAGCKYCYMYRDKQRYGHDGSVVIRAGKDKWREAYNYTEPKKIFTCSWSDFFIKEADTWRPEAWKVIKETPQHTWIILTKRPERILQHLPPDWGKGYDNVWLGVSAENQKTLHTRVMELFKVPCKVRLLSLEPLLQRVDVTPYLHVQLGDTEWVYPIHWVIVGGESGNDTGDYLYRPCRTEWLHDIVKACKEKDVPVFVKQLGTAASKMLDLKSRHGDDLSEQAFPVYLKHQEFPKIVEI